MAFVIESCCLSCSYLQQLVTSPRGSLNLLLRYPVKVPHAIVFLYSFDLWHILYPLDETLFLTVFPSGKETNLPSRLMPYMKLIVCSTICILCPYFYHCIFKTVFYDLFKCSSLPLEFL